MSTRYDNLEEIDKFNPYHDALGRFSSANGATSMTIHTHSAAGQKAINNIRDREKAKMGGGGGSSSESTRTIGRGNQSEQRNHPDGKWGDVKEPWKDWPDEAIESVAKRTGTSKAEAEKMADAVNDFSRSGYDSIREYQQNGPPPDEREKADAIEEFIEKSPKWDGGPVYRGIGVDRETGEKIIAAASRGENVGMLGTASFSTEKHIADSFADSNTPWPDGISIIFISDGKQNGTSIRNLSGFYNENEVLMSNDARWKPTDVEQISDRTYYVYCDPVS